MLQTFLYFLFVSFGASKRVMSTYLLDLVGKSYLSLPTAGIGWDSSSYSMLLLFFLTACSTDVLPVFYILRKSYVQKFERGKEPFV